MSTKFKMSYENGETNAFYIKDIQLDQGRMHQVSQVVTEEGQVISEGLTVIDNGDCLRIPATDGDDDVIIDYGTAELLLAVIYHNLTTVEGVKFDKMEKE